MFGLVGALLMQFMLGTVLVRPAVEVIAFMLACLVSRFGAFVATWMNELMPPA